MVTQKILIFELHWKLTPGNKNDKSHSLPCTDLRRPIQWYHFQVDLIWSDDLFKGTASEDFLL